MLGKGKRSDPKILCLKVAENKLVLKNTLTAMLLACFWFFFFILQLHICFDYIYVLIFFFSSHVFIND